MLPVKLDAVHRLSDHLGVKCGRRQLAPALPLLLLLLTCCSAPKVQALPVAANPWARAFEPVLLDVQVPVVEGVLGVDKDDFKKQMEKFLNVGAAFLAFVLIIVLRPVERLREVS